MEYLKKFYDQAFNWLLIYGPRILIGIIVWMLGQWVIRIINRWLKKWLGPRNIDSSLRTFIESLLSAAMQILLVLLLMQILGIQMTIFAAIIAAFGVAAGLALSGTLQNFASGVLILILKPYHVGDNVVTQSQEGTVTSIQLFYTVITTFDNKTVIVPNSKLSNEIIINLSRQGKRRLDIELKFKYTVDFSQLKQVILSSLEDSHGVLQEPPPRVGVALLDIDSYKVNVNVWTSAHGFEDNRLALLEKLMKDIKSGGILFPGMK
jgi:small conductance mechanosensitive channel